MAPSLQLITLARYITSPSRCGYLPAERASLAYRVLMDVIVAQHEALLSRGWRRFGCEWFRVCPTFYTRGSSIIWGPCSIKSAMSRERYFIA